MLGVAGGRAAEYDLVTVNRHRFDRTRDEIVDLARDGLDWVTFSAAAADALRRAIPFDRSCWHTVDPGTVLFTGSLHQNIQCSGSWLAEHEYVIDDVNQWRFLARSGRKAGSTGIATHGDLSRCARNRSNNSMGDELRGSFVVDDTYWGAAAFVRERGDAWFTEDDVRLLASLSEPIARAFRRALVVTAEESEPTMIGGPGVVVFDVKGNAESISPAAERWIEQIVEIPAPTVPSESKTVQAVAARARALRAGQDPLELAAQCRARTRTGSWLLLYGTPLSGEAEGRTAVIIQPAARGEVAPLVALAYGLSDRERQVIRLCMQGRSTKEMARALQVSPYTVQDHLKSIFEKTGARSRGEVVGQIFLEQYVPGWEEVEHSPSGWFGYSNAFSAIPPPGTGVAVDASNLKEAGLPTQPASGADAGLGKPGEGAVQTHPSVIGVSK